MNKFCSIILVIFFFIGIFDGGISKQNNLSRVEYAALTNIVTKREAGVESRNVTSNAKDSEIAPIKKYKPKTPITPKKEANKAQLDLIKIKNSGVVNIVFFGLDGGSLKQYSRSDSIMVVSIDKKKNKLKVTSLMRDMYLPIPGKGSNRINAAYAIGGPSLAIKTINANFGLSITDYVTVDFTGLEKMIDYMGGVSIKISNAEAKVLNTCAFATSGLSGDKVQKVNSGIQSLNGKQAVTYCRIRYVGHADYERTERQRRVLNEILRKLKQTGITKLPKTVSTVLPYVKTSLSAGEVLKLALTGVGLKTDSIEQYRLPVDGSYKSRSINGMAVLVPDIEANNKKLYEFVYGIK